METPTMRDANGASNGNHDRFPGWAKRRGGGVDGPEATPDIPGGGRERPTPRHPKTSLMQQRPHQRQPPQQQQPLSPRSKEELRLRVNARERQRMHDMNSALDALRTAMPYARGPSVKKLSKMNTLLLARNYILLLTKTTEDLRRMLAEAIGYGGGGGGSLAGWPARLDAAVLLGSVQDAYDKQRRYAEELLLRQEQQQQQQINHNHPLHQQKQQLKQQPEDDKPPPSWKSVSEFEYPRLLHHRHHHRKDVPTSGSPEEIEILEKLDSPAAHQHGRMDDANDDDGSRKASKRRHRDRDVFLWEFPKKAKPADKPGEIPGDPKEAVNGNGPEVVASGRGKIELEAPGKIENGSSENRKLRSGGKVSGKAEEGEKSKNEEKQEEKKKEEEEEEEKKEEEEEDVVVDSSFSAEDGDRRTAGKTEEDDDDDEDDAALLNRRHHDHHHHRNHQHHPQQQQQRQPPLLLSSLLSSSSPPQLTSEEKVSSTTARQRSAFQPIRIEDSKTPVERSQVQIQPRASPKRQQQIQQQHPQRQADALATADRNSSCGRKMAVRSHFPFFIPQSIPAYHHHHHHHLLPHPHHHHLHPLLAHASGVQGAAHARQVLMTSLLESGRVIGPCPCQLCLPKDPI